MANLQKTIIFAKQKTHGIGNLPYRTNIMAKHI